MQTAPDLSFSFLDHIFDNHKHNQILKLSRAFLILKIHSKFISDISYARNKQNLNSYLKSGNYIAKYSYVFPACYISDYTVDFFSKIVY